MDIRKIFREHSIALLVALAVVFWVVLVGYYVWGVGYLLTSEDAAENRAAANSQLPQFNLDMASKLDYRGISVASTSQ